jgi:hypothetical protein
MLGNYYFMSDYDSCVYFRKLLNGLFLCLLLYVDDMLITSKNMYRINNLKDRLSDEFEMKDLGAKMILGMKIGKDRNTGKLFLSQRKYLKKILKHFGMHDYKTVSALIAPISCYLQLCH